MWLFALPRRRRADALEAEVRELQERLRALRRQVDEQGGQLEALTAITLSIYRAQRSSNDRDEAVSNVVH